nr:PREDICTED: uncharacterized protein LOC105672092 isoform X3 [Linepithema humile]
MFYALCIFIVVVFGLSAAKEVPLRLPEFDFPPLDPFTFEFGNVVFDRDAIHGVVNISNFIGEGLSKTRFLAVRPYFDDEVFRLEVDLQTPKLTGSSEISVEGTVHGFRINGKGPFNLSMEDLETKWIIKGPVANDIWTVEDFYAAPSIKKMILP